MSTPVLLDCDPGHDDAIALLLALASPELELLGVTTVAGNQTIEKTTANAIRVIELAGATCRWRLGQTVR
jgi:purine nucleosidase